jgi:hypothetical protein
MTGIDHRLPPIQVQRSKAFDKKSRSTTSSDENRLRVLMMDRPLHRRIHLNRLSQEVGPPLNQPETLPEIAPGEQRPTVEADIVVVV